MSTAADQQRLADLIRTKVDEAMREVGTVDTWGWATWHVRNSEADKVLVSFFETEEGARFTYKAAHEHRVRLAGHTASSTSGHRQALLNWRATVLKRLAAQDVAA